MKLCTLWDKSDQSILRDSNPQLFISNIKHLWMSYVQARNLATPWLKVASNHQLEWRLTKLPYASTKFNFSP
jgi:hypothetical protein